MFENNAPRVRTRTRPAAPSAPPPSSAPLKPQMALTPIGELKPASRQIRKRDKDQLDVLISTIERFGVVAPILITGEGEVVDGHPRLEACGKLGIESVPTVVVDHLSPPEIKALRIALHAVQEKSTFDPEGLKLELQGLFEGAPSLLPFTALPKPKIDQVMLAGLGVVLPGETAPEPQAEVVSLPWLSRGPAGEGGDPARSTASLAEAPRRFLRKRRQPG